MEKSKTKNFWENDYFRVNLSLNKDTAGQFTVDLPEYRTIRKALIYWSTAKQVRVLQFWMFYVKIVLENGK